MDFKKLRADLDRELHLFWGQTRSNWKQTYVDEMKVKQIDEYTQLVANLLHAFRELNEWLRRNK
jgi:hypothetical protein